MTTPQQRRADIRALMAAEPPQPADEPEGMVGWLQRLCRTAVRALPASGSGISLMTSDGARGVAAASAPRWRALEEHQFTLGEGPCIDAFRTRRPVLEPDLCSPSASRWPGYTATAQQHGVRAVFAVPLQVGATRLGTFAVYRTTAGALSMTSLAQALTFTELAVETLLDGQERAPVGKVEATLDKVMDTQFTVYQAQGMAMVDLGISLTDAMARLQAHAYSHNRSLQDVARDIVAGKLRLERDAP